MIHRFTNPQAVLSGLARKLRQAAGYRASRRARSTREWIAKIGVVIEELDECDHWLSMISDSSLAAPPQNLITESRALRAVLAKSAATARKRHNARWKH